MRRQTGFSLIETLVAMTLTLVVVAAIMSAFADASHATEAVTLMADTQQNLRAGLNYMIRDITQAGNGIPLGGITIPNSGGSSPTSSVTRPGPFTAPATSFGTFPTSWTVLPAVTPGYQAGPTTTTSGVGTDMVTVLYADNSLVDANGHWLNEFPILGSSGTAGCAATNPNPNPLGTIVTSGTTTTITFDSSCMIINNGNTGLAVGDLIMLQNNNTTGSASMTASDAGVDNST